MENSVIIDSIEEDYAPRIVTTLDEGSIYYTVRQYDENDVIIRSRLKIKSIRSALHLADAWAYEGFEIPASEDARRTPGD